MKIATITAPNPGPLTLSGTQSYVLDETVIIDPGPTDESHLAAMLEAAPRLAAVVVTHRHADHAPAAAILRQRHRTPVYAPAGALDADDIDHVLHDGQLLRIGEVTLEALHTPGHTAEHFCFLTPEGDLFTGDTILGEGTTVIFPPDGDMDLYLRSLERLRSASPHKIYPGHGPARESAVALIDEYIAHRLQREAQVLDALSARHLQITAIRQQIYPQLDPRLHRPAELQIEAHLDRLIKQHRVLRSGDDYRPA